MNIYIFADNTETKLWVISLLLLLTPPLSQSSAQELCAVAELLRLGGLQLDLLSQQEDPSPWRVRGPPN